MTYETFPTSVTNLNPMTSILETRRRQGYGYSAVLSSDNEMLAFLGRLQKPAGTYDAAHVKEVIHLWESLKGAFSFRLPLPLVQPTVEGNIQLVWDVGWFYLDIDMRRDFRLEWFFRNRETNELDGTEDEPEYGVSDALIARLWCICSA